MLPQYINLGFYHLRIYGLTMATAVLVGYLIGRRHVKKQGVDLETFDDIVFWLVIIAFLSARIYDVIFYFSLYKNNLWEIPKIWHGGLAIYGAVIGGIATLYYFAKRKNIPFLKLADIAAFALPLSQAIGRFGNLFNYEAFGNPTNLPWKMFVPFQFRPQGYQQYSYFTPTFAYEAIWDVLVFFVLWAISKKQPKQGVIFSVYLFLYSFGRFFIEGIRLDSAWFGPFRGDQLTAVLLMVVAAAVYAKIKIFN